MSELCTPDELAGARRRIAPHVRRTPLLAAPDLGAALGGCDLRLKAELFQLAGSFKVRGVFNKVLSTTEAERRAGFAAFSAGNHAMAVACAAATIGVAVTVCMPTGAVKAKVEAARAYGAEVILVDGNLPEFTLSLVAERGLTLIHPFDDRAIVAGHASLGAELIEDEPELDLVVVPVGGGGLIGGVAAAVKQRRPSCRVVGVEPSAADVVSRSLAAGSPQPHPGPASLADGLNAPITGAVPLAHIERFVDEVVRVEEDAIAAALRLVLTSAKLAAEPAAAAGIAALASGAVAVRPGQRVAVVVSGGNVDLSLYGRL